MRAVIFTQQATKLSQPCVGPLHDPATLVTPQFAPVLIPSPFVVLAIGGNQFDASFPQALPQRVGIVSGIGNHTLRLLPRAALRTRYPDLVERGFRKLNFTGGGTFQLNSQRKTFTVDQYHPLRALAPLGFADGSAPFFAGAKLPSRKASSHFKSPSWSSAPNHARHAWSQTPSSSHCLSRRQQVEGEGNSSGRNRQAAPVWRIHKMPSKQARLGAGGRPRRSARCRDGGRNDPTNSHCSSVNSFCRSFMTEAQPLTCLTHKYLM